MKNLFFAMKLEIRACLRQLSSTLTLNAAWRLVLVAFAVLMSAALGYLRLTGMPMEALLAAGFAVSLLAGAIAFNRRNAEMLLSCEKTQALRTLPMDFRILQSSWKSCCSPPRCCTLPSGDTSSPSCCSPDTSTVCSGYIPSAP